jgi:hypothetical protein
MHVADFAISNMFEFRRELSEFDISPIESGIYVVCRFTKDKYKLNEEFS